MGSLGTCLHEVLREVLFSSARGQADAGGGGGGGGGGGSRLDFPTCPTFSLGLQTK